MGEANTLPPGQLALHKRWQAMMSRCYKPHYPGYESYGGRGIDVEPYLQDKYRYAEYVTSLPGWEPGTPLHLDREDNSKGYWRGNLRWVESAENAKNKRTNVVVEYNDEKLCFEDFVRKYTKYSSQRAGKLFRAGHTLEEIAAMVPRNVGRRASLGFIERS